MEAQCYTRYNTVLLILIKKEISSHGASCSFSVGSSVLWGCPVILFTRLRRRPLIDVSCSSSSSSIGIPTQHKHIHRTLHPWSAINIKAISLSGLTCHVYDVYCGMYRFSYYSAISSHLLLFSVWRVPWEFGTIAARLRAPLDRWCHRRLGNSIIYQYIKMSEKSERHWTIYLLPRHRERDAVREKESISWSKCRYNSADVDSSSNSS